MREGQRADNFYVVESETLEVLSGGDDGPQSPTHSAQATILGDRPVGETAAPGHGRGRIGRRPVPHRWSGLPGCCLSGAGRLGSTRRMITRLARRIPPIFPTTTSIVGISIDKVRVTEADLHPPSLRRRRSAVTGPLLESSCICPSPAADGVSRCLITT